MKLLQETFLKRKEITSLNINVDTSPKTGGELNTRLSFAYTKPSDKMGKLNTRLSLAYTKPSDQMGKLDTRLSFAFTKPFKFTILLNQS